LNRAVFLDRDGTINRDVPYCSRPEDFELLPKVAEGIRILNQHGFKVVVITNQSGITRGYFTVEALSEVHQKMKDELTVHGAKIDAVYYCPHHPDDKCSCRKPSPELILKAASDLAIDLAWSYVIGDRDIDIDAGKQAGCRTILLNSVSNPSHPSHNRISPDAVVSDVAAAASFIINWEELSEQAGH